MNLSYFSYLPLLDLQVLVFFLIPNAVEFVHAHLPIWEHLLVGRFVISIALPNFALFGCYNWKFLDLY
jgi:hypothetical protein